MRILALGDVVGTIGTEALRRHMPALKKVADKVAYFARKEGLDAHARSAVIRTEEEK